MAVYIKELVWDDSNLDHIEIDNGIPFEDVEAAVIFEQRDSYKKGGKLFIVGQDDGGRYLTVVLESRGEADVWRPVTANPSDPKEVRRAKKKKR